MSDSAVYQGMKWIWGPTRWAIYLRDSCPERGMRCLWCNKTVVCAGWPGKRRVCLDHLTPRSKGGTNHPRNLITCCIPCNNKRRASDYQDWLECCNWDEVVWQRIEICRNTPLDKGLRLLGRWLYELRPHDGVNKPPHWSDP